MHLKPKTISLFINKNKLPQELKLELESSIIFYNNCIYDFIKNEDSYSIVFSDDNCAHFQLLMKNISKLNELVINKKVKFNGKHLNKKELDSIYNSMVENSNKSVISKESSVKSKMLEKKLPKLNNLKNDNSIENEDLECNGELKKKISSINKTSTVENYINYFKTPSIFKKDPQNIGPVKKNFNFSIDSKVYENSIFNFYKNSVNVNNHFSFNYRNNELDLNDTYSSVIQNDNKFFK